MTMRERAEDAWRLWCVDLKPIDDPVAFAAAFAEAEVRARTEAARKACEAIAERHMNEHGKMRMAGQGEDVVCDGETTAMECALAIRDLERNPDPLKPEPEGTR